MRPKKEKKQKAVLPPLDQRFAPSTVAAEIAERILDRWPIKFGGLGAAHVLYLTKIGGIVAQGQRKAGKIERVTGQKKYLSRKPENDNEGWDYIVTLDAEVWDGASDALKERIIFHELKHTLHDERDDGSDDWKIVPHDIETFVDETEIYGSGRELVDLIALVVAKSEEKE